MTCSMRDGDGDTLRSEKPEGDSKHSSGEDASVTVLSGHPLAPEDSCVDRRAGGASDVTEIRSQLREM